MLQKPITFNLALSGLTLFLVVLGIMPIVVAFFSGISLAIIRAVTGLDLMSYFGWVWLVIVIIWFSVWMVQTLRSGYWGLQFEPERLIVKKYTGKVTIHPDAVQKVEWKQKEAIIHTIDQVLPMQIINPQKVAPFVFLALLHWLPPSFVRADFLQMRQDAERLAKEPIIPLEDPISARYVPWAILNRGVTLNVTGVEVSLIFGKRTFPWDDIQMVIVHPDKYIKIWRDGRFDRVWLSGLKPDDRETILEVFLYAMYSRAIPVGFSATDI